MTRNMEKALFSFPPPPRFIRESVRHIVGLERELETGAIDAEAGYV